MKRRALGMSFPALCTALLAIPLWITGCPSAVVPTLSPPANTQPGVAGNQRPSFAFINPDRTVSVSVGEIFVIAWVDSDPDNSATIDLLRRDGSAHSWQARMDFALVAIRAAALHDPRFSLLL